MPRGQADDQTGIADPARVCIYGVSYGGYAALMGVIREPDLYRTSETAMGKSYLKEFVGQDAADLKACSPVYNVDRIKAPLFLAHGKDDARVRFENFTELTSALDRAGKTYETLVKADEGHGFCAGRTLKSRRGARVPCFARRIGERTLQGMASARKLPMALA